MSSVSINHRHTRSVEGVNKVVDNGHWNRDPYSEKIYTQLCCSYQPWLHLIEFSVDFVPQVFYWPRQCGHGHCPAGTCDAGDGQNRAQCEVEGLD